MKIPDENEHLRKLFIGGLTLSTTDEMLKEFYCQWGDVVDHIVMKDPQTKRSRGFGFVTYAEVDSLEESMRNRPHVIDGRQVDPKRAVPRESMQAGATASGGREPCKRLFVSGIKDDHTDDMLQDYFGNYGMVTKVEIIADKTTGQRRGFAFVNFEDYDSVDKCVLERSHTIAGKRCDVKKAEARDNMRTPQQDRDRMGRTSFRGGRGGGGMRGGRDDAWGGGGGRGGSTGGGWNQGGGQSWGTWGAQPASNPYAGYGGGYQGYSQPMAQGYGQTPAPYGQQAYGGYTQPQATTQWGAQPAAAAPQAGGWPAQTPAAYPGYGAQPAGYGAQPTGYQ